jgi:hypothetical protein
VTGAVYALSYWHYFLYWLAYYFGSVSLPVFQRDALAMKTVSLVALAVAYFAAPLNFISLAVVGGGYLLNILAARALGADRTYYGYELTELAPLRVDAFPYSWIAHPMLVGNMAAFGGTLINAPFRSIWWPLACVHVALNLGLLLMEKCLAPRHGRPLRALGGALEARLAAAGYVLLAVGGVSACMAAGGRAFVNHGSLVGIVVAAAGYALAMFGNYTQPRDARRRAQAQEAACRLEAPAGAVGEV